MMVPCRSEGLACKFNDTPVTRLDDARALRAILTLLATSCLIPMLAVAQSTTIRATAIRTAVTLDARLDEPFWATTDSIDDFRQREPLEGSPATERTVVKVARDADAL